jgi:hypothetical protein
VDAPAWTDQEAGLIVAYRFTYRDQVEVPAAGDGLAPGDARLEGQLRLEWVDVGGQVAIALQVTRLDAVEWGFGGADAPDTESLRAALIGPEAIAHGRGGIIESVEVDAGTARPFAILADRVLRLLQLPTVGGAAELDTGWGVATTHTVWTPHDGGVAVRARRAASEYASIAIALGPADGELRGEAEITATVRDGLPADVRTRESLRHRGGSGRSDALSLRVEEISRRTPRSIGADARWTAARSAKSHARTRALEERVRGMTWESMRDDLLRYGAGGKMPEHNRWLWRAAGLLRLDPAMAEKLEALFFDDGLEGPTKALVLDLLAQVGHPEAQAALRRILSDPRAQARADFGQLIQRAGFVREPEAATVQTVQGVFESPPTPEASRASAATLGALAAASGAEAPVDALLDAAAQASGLDREAALVGLGNSRNPKAREVIAKGLSAPEESTRAAAARALRHFTDDESRSQLVALLGDSSAAVAQGALSALREHAPTELLLVQLTQAVKSGGVSAAVARPLIDSAATWNTDAAHPALLGLAQALAAHPWQEQTTGHAAVNLLRAVQGR